MIRGMSLPHRGRAVRPHGPTPVPPTVSRSLASPSRRRSLPAGRCLPLLFVLLVAACTDRAAQPTLAPDVIFRTLSGERLALRKASGPTLVSFWSTDCAICLAELPALADLHADFASRGFELVAVAMPYDPPNAVLELAEARALPFPVALDIDGAVLAAFEPIAGTPTSFLVDAGGRVIDKHVGPTDFPALRDTLDGLLGAASPSARAAPSRDAPPDPTSDDRPAIRPATKAVALPAAPSDRVRG